MSRVGSGRVRRFSNVAGRGRVTLTRSDPRETMRPAKIPATCCTIHLQFVLIRTWIQKCKRGSPPPRYHTGPRRKIVSFVFFSAKGQGTVHVFFGSTFLSKRSPPAQHHANASHQLWGDRILCGAWLCAMSTFLSL